MTRTTATTTAANLSGRGYDADQSRLPAESPSFSSGSPESTFTPASQSHESGRPSSVSLRAPTQQRQETQVVDETPREVEVQRAKESFAALTSEATELEIDGGESGSSVELGVARGEGKRRSEGDEVIAATDDEDTPPNKGASL